MNDFDEWLASRIDAQTISPELRRALRAQYDAERQPPAEAIVVVDDEVWNQAIREPAL